MAAPETPSAAWQSDALLGRLMLRMLVQAPDGLLWVGTADDAYRYDGTRLVPLNALRRGRAAPPVVACPHLLPVAPHGAAQQLVVGAHVQLIVEALNVGVHCVGR